MAAFAKMDLMELKTLALALRDAITKFWRLDQRIQEPDIFFNELGIDVCQTNTLFFWVLVYVYLYIYIYTVI